METMTFNLCDEPWLRVRQMDNTVKEVSLLDALLNAHQYADLAGETDTLDAAALRLLLAILITVFSRVNAKGEESPFDSSDDALTRWKELWELGHFPEKPIRDYLDRWHERFWLFHPERPFWQVTEAAIGTEYKAPKLNGELSESSNKLRLFAAYSGTGKAELSYAQAARWLLFVNAFDDTSAKPKGKNLPSVGAGWVGKIGFIQAQGDNLFETLMLNMTFLKDGRELWSEENKPCWELDEARSGERTEIAMPQAPAQLLTLQSRRLLLQRKGDRVTGFSLLGGDFFQRENAFAEQMTIWQAPKPKKNEKIAYVPCRHDPSKQFWREFPAVFNDQDDSTHKPGVVSWVTTLQGRKVRAIDRSRLVRFRISGVQYGDKDFFINDSFSDTLSFQTCLLDDMSSSWRTRIVDEIDRCEQAARLVGRFAQELATAAGDRNETAEAAGRAQLYFAVDQHFRQWLQGINAEQDDEDEKTAKWRSQARRIAEELARQMIEQAGSEAFVGRRITYDKGKKTERTILFNAPLAYNRFLARIRTLYPKEEQQGGKA